MGARSLGGGSASMQTPLTAQRAVGRILDGLTGGNKALQQSTDDEGAPPRLDSAVHGLVARFGKAKAKPVAKKQPKGDPLKAGSEYWSDGDAESDKLLKFAAHDTGYGDHEKKGSMWKKKGWNKYAKRITLVPNQ